jgi:hypothetical protein
MPERTRPLARDPGAVPRISEMTPGYQFPRTAGELIAAREAQLAALAPAVRDCPNGHGPMKPRPLAGQAYEQLFCGLWWDCDGRCASSTLAVSRDLAYQNGEPYLNDGTWEKWGGTAWIPVADEELGQWRAACRERADAVERKRLRAPRHRKRRAAL